MGVINRKNAAISWLTWVVTKRVVKKKAKDDPDVTVEMSFTGADWKVTAVKPRL